MILCWIDNKAKWVYKYIITSIKFNSTESIHEEKCQKCKLARTSHPMTPIGKNTYQKLCTLEVMQHELFDYNKLEFFKLKKKDLI